MPASCILPASASPNFSPGSTACQMNSAGRLLPFDAASALHYPRVMALSKQAGVTMKERDTQLAAICLNHQASLVTDNAGVFAHTGVIVVNPWDVVEAPRWREEAAEYYVMSRKT